MSVLWLPKQMTPNRGAENHKNRSSHSSGVQTSEIAVPEGSKGRGRRLPSAPSVWGLPTVLGL